MDQCSRILAFYKSGMPIRDRSITSLWSKTRDRPSRIDWHHGLSFPATVSYLSMVENAISVQTAGLLNGVKCSLMVGVGCLEIARVASDPGGDFGFLTRSLKD